MDLLMFAVLLLGPRVQPPEYSPLFHEDAQVQHVKAVRDQVDLAEQEAERREARNRRIAAYRRKYGGGSRVQVNHSAERDESPQAVTARKALAYRIDFSFFKEDMTLEDSFAALEKVGVPLVIMWRDLEENAFVDKNTNIGIEGSGVMSVEQALGLILRSVSSRDMPLEYVVEGGVITVATRDTAVAKRELRVYDVAELAGAGGWFGDQGGRNQNQYRGGYNSGRSGFNGGSGYNRGGMGSFNSRRRRR